MSLGLLWWTGAAVAFHALATHGSYEEAATCDWTNFLQDALSVSQRVSSRKHNVASAVLSVEGAAEYLETTSSWPRLKRSLSQLLAYIPSLKGPPTLPSHPFPSLDWSEVKFPSALICAIVLFCAGVLCSAGGIGGGGVYVTVLMVAGQLSPHDAVPLSKAVVFCGSLSSLVLNLRKSLVPQANGARAEVLIDYNICRLVVPSALFGTLMGVLLNSMIAPWLIVAMLASILLMMTWMSCKEFFKHYRAEGAHGSTSGENAPSGPTGTEVPGPAPSPQLQKPIVPRKVSEDVQSIRGTLCQGEGCGALIILVLVIFCGVVRAHAAACQMDLITDVADLYGRDACERPIIKSFFGSDLLRWMEPRKPSADVLLYGTIFVPATTCLAIVIGYSVFLARREQWLPRNIALYCIMAVLTGCFAGLVGIGGGLVFSPFILWMSGEPGVAVATSSTLVIFTSSSTTFQYLFTDRITMSLTIIYGLINLTASYVGTTTVHMLDTMSNRKTLISGIVCLGVIASVILSVYKLASMGVGH